MPAPPRALVHAHPTSSAPHTPCTFCTFCRLPAFATFNEIDVLKFCFALFDDDKNGFIEKDELDYLLECLHDGGYAAKIEELLLNVDTDRDQRIDFVEFSELNTAYPFLLFPAYKFQQAIVRETFGEQQWERKNVQATRQRGRARRRQAHMCHKHLQKARIHTWKALLNNKDVGVLGVLEHGAYTQVRSLLNLGKPEPSVQCASDKGWNLERLAGANYKPVEKRRAEEHLRAFDVPGDDTDDEAQGADTDGGGTPKARGGTKDASGKKRRKKKRRGGAKVAPAGEREALEAEAQAAQGEGGEQQKDQQGDEPQRQEQEPQQPQESKKSKGGRRYSIEM